MKYPHIMSASAGSGKTHTITEEIFNRIDSGEVRPEHIIATTFTVKAANELKARIREKLLMKGKVSEAKRMNLALIGTINSICLTILQHNAIDAGISPFLETLDEDDQKVIMREILGEVIDEDFIQLSYKLYQTESQNYSANTDPYLDHIEQLILQSRINNLSKTQLMDQADMAVEGFLGLYQGEITDHEKRKDVVIDFFDVILNKLSGHTIISKKDKEAVRELAEIKRKLNYSSDIWNDWVKLSKFSVAKKYGVQEEADQLSQVVGNLFDDSLFRADYTEYIKRCYKYAFEAIDQYDLYKAERGLVDFTDQESKFYELIRDNPEIRSKLASEYQLIVVDEFQDVSPLQLAIFMELVQIVDNSIWVGDPKQSIYGFRGADATLMKTVLDALPPEYKDQLSDSYRSREPLISFTNALFSEAFKDSMDQKEIILSQADKNITGRNVAEEEEYEPAINYWKFNCSGRAIKKDQFDSLALKILELIQSGNQVFDKSVQSYRKATYGDIAILCRSNFNCQKLAQSLQRTGIPVSVSGFGLNQEPEVIFMLALLKLMVVPFDTLAKAEVLLYSTFDGNQEDMINDLLKEADISTWNLDHKYLTALKAIRTTAFDYSPVKAIETILNKLNLEELFTAWGNIHQRISNIDALLSHALGYQEMCNRLKIASTIMGFINWMKSLGETEEDKTGVKTGNAVQIMTYHGCKGLEWPMVILWDLDFDPKDNFYGINVTSDSPLDISDPLKDRGVSLCVKPFHKTTKFESFQDIIDQSPFKIQSDYLRDEEEKRLFYVAVTRARDYLYLCSVKNKFTIPDLVAPKANQLQLGDGLNQSEITWKGQELMVKAESIPIQKDLDLESYKTSSGRMYFPPSSGRTSYDKFSINPSQETPIEGMGVRQIIDISTKYAVNRNNVKESVLGDVIHNLLCSFRVGRNQKESEKLFNRMLIEYDFNTILKPDVLYKIFSDFHQFILSNYNPVKIHKELPVQYINENGNYVSGYVDMVLEEEERLIIIDYKTYSSGSNDVKLLKDKAISYSGQLSLYQEMLEKAFDKPVEECWIYFVFEGKMVQVEVNETETTVDSISVI